MLNMETRQNNQLITMLVTRMILQIAPHEMQLFQGQKEEYLRNPQQIITKRGFTNQGNNHEKILFLAPIIRNILSDVIAMLECDTQPTLQTVKISSEKAKEIYAYAYEKAQQYQLAPIKAHLVADAVLDNLSSPKTAS